MKNPSSKRWFLFDDARVRQLGKHFSDVIAVVERARLQPLLLFFEQRRE